MTTLQVPIAIQKKCSCGLNHTLVPIGARADVMGGEVIAFVWECTCHSTLYYRTVSMEKYAELFNKEMKEVA